jgi:hypothetical protein
MGSLTLVTPLVMVVEDFLSRLFFGLVCSPFTLGIAAELRVGYTI